MKFPIFIELTAVLALILACMPHAGLGGQHVLPQDREEKGSGQPEKGKGRFTVGKETTYVTGPVGKDGRVDYVAALNERMGQGVTPESNANVLLWKAMGPRPEGGKPMPAKFFRLMGMAAPPEKGEYFIDFVRYAKEHLQLDPAAGGTALNDRLDCAHQRPWTSKEYPEVASWLKANEKPLALLVEATRRKHYFSPLVPSETGSSGLILARLPGVQRCREVVSALLARALLRVGQGAGEDAWQDLLACHRLGRLVGRGGTVIEALVGIAIDNVVARADLVFLDRVPPDAKRIAGCQRDLRELPPLPDLAEKADLGERLVFLDNVMMLDRFGMKNLNGLFGGEASKRPLDEAILRRIDWDQALRSANSWYDRVAAALREKDWATRQEKLAQIESELRVVRDRAAKVEDLAGAVADAKEPAKALGKALGDLLISNLMPAVSKVQGAADRSRQRQDNLLLAFGLARYRLDHGRYPKELSVLTPKYLEQVAGDLFSAKALVYAPGEDGYLLYSVGINGRDDGGRGPDEQPPGDDLAIRMPLPELGRK